MTVKLALICNISVSVLQQKFVNSAYALKNFKINLINSVLGRFPHEKLPPRKFPPGAFHPRKFPRRKLSPGMLFLFLTAIWLPHDQL